MRVDLESIAVIGPFADAARDSVGPWIFRQDDAETVTILAGIRKAVGNATRVDHSVGVSVPKRLHASIFENPFMPATPRIEVDDDAEIARAVRLAKEAEVAVLVLGEAQIMIGEHASRSSLDLPGRQPRVHGGGLASHHLAAHRDDTLAADRFGGLEHRARNVHDDLGHAIVVAQIDEQQIAMVALALDPARQAGLLADMLGAQLAARMGSVDVRHHIFRFDGPAKGTDCAGKSSNWAFPLPPAAPPAI